MTTLPPIRWATHEAEAHDAAMWVKHREEVRLCRLAAAWKAWRFDRCTHHGGNDCAPCLLSWEQGGNRVAALATIDAALATEPTPQIQIGNVWEVPVGPIMAAEVKRMLALPDDFSPFDPVTRRSQQRPQIALPAVYLFAYGIRHS